MAMLPLFRHRATSGLLQLRVSRLTGWLRRIGESTSQFSWLSFLSLYGYNINEICGHYLMNHVRLISGGSVCKDGLLPPKFAPLFREKCGQSNQNCDYGEWRSNPIVHQKSFTLRTSRFLSTLFSLFALLLASFTSRSLRFKAVADAGDFFDNPFLAFHQNIEETELG